MTLQFAEREFNGMLFNPIKIMDGVSVFKTFPDLKRYKIFQKSPGSGVDNEMLMLYIFCMYDKNTPYRHKYHDVLRRKVEVAHDVGFVSAAGGKFDPPVEDFMKGKNPVVNEKIVEFVRIHKSFKYAYFVSVESSYYNALLGIMGGETKKMAEVKGMQEELEQTMTEMLNDDSNPYLKDQLLRYMEEDRLLLRPEDMALKLSKGEQPITAEEIQ